jgi:ABC-type transport system substrate-binding protein
MPAHFLKRLVFSVAVAGAALTCAPPSAQPPSAPPPPTSEYECELLSEPEEMPGEITVATLDPVAIGHAPWPQSDGERLVFRHLYETLLRVDCRGSVHPGLAESWSAEEGGRVWRFTLREGARFWDGVPVTADDVVAGWMGGAAEKLAFAAGIDSIVVEGQRRLAVFLDRPHGEVPRMFADPEFAVARSVEPRHWPQGSVPGGIESGEPVDLDQVDRRCPDNR